MRDWTPPLLFIGVLILVQFGRWLWRERYSFVSGKWPTIRGTVLSATIEDISDSEAASFRVRVIYSYPAGDPPPYTGEYTITAQSSSGVTSGSYTLSINVIEIEPLEFDESVEVEIGEGQPAYFGVYLDVPPITEVVVKAKRILGFQPTPFEAGLKETYRWYLRNAKKSKIDYSFEDRLIEMATVAPAAD